MTSIAKANISVSSIRIVHWGLVLLTFFLPAIEGCNKKIIYPYLECQTIDSWLQTLIYLYPVLLAVLSLVVLSLKSDHSKFGVAWVICYILFLAVTYAVYTAFLEMPGWYTAILIFFWGVLGVALSRCHSHQRVFDLLGFLCSGMALWLFPMVYLFREKILYGGWLFVYANAVVLLSYAIELPIRKRKG